MKCVGFDTSTDFNKGAGGTSGAYGQNFGLYPVSGTSEYRGVMDTTVKASGAGALKFIIPSNSGADSSGSWFTNFSSDLQTQFGENSEFFVQWRQRFSSSLLATNFVNSGGWKQIILGSGDKPGGGTPYQSCTALEVVVQEADMHGFPKMYNSCTGSASHAAYDGFVQYFNGDYKLQNARPTPYCLLSQVNTSFFPPSGNCFKYQPNEWMTFQVRIKTGPRVGDEFTNSFVSLWIAREGRASEAVFDWGPYNLSAGDAASGQRFGKIWLLPYNTNKDAAQVHPEAYTWYDELIISRNRIADPQ